MKIKPFGSRILVSPLDREDYKTETGLDVVQNELRKGEVIEVSDSFSETFPVGTIVLYPEGEGMGEYYKGKACIWLDCRPVNQGGHVWAIVEP